MKTPFFFNLTPEIEITDSYLVFLMLEQFLNYVVVAGAGGWKTVAAGSGYSLAIWTRCGTGCVTPTWTRPGPRMARHR